MPDLDQGAQAAVQSQYSEYRRGSGFGVVESEPEEEEEEEEVVLKKKTTKSTKSAKKSTTAKSTKVVTPVLLEYCLLCFALIGTRSLACYSLPFPFARPNRPLFFALSPHPPFPFKYIHANIWHQPTKIMLCLNIYIYIYLFIYFILFWGGGSRVWFLGGQWHPPVLCIPKPNTVRIMVFTALPAAACLRQEVL